MKTKILLSSMLFVSLIALMSFKYHIATQAVVGVYSVCNSQNSPKFEVTLNKDYTFHYFNSYDPKNIIDVKGKWDFKGRQIVLKDYSSSIKIHDKWHLDKTNKCIKSRLGMEWTRLCNVGEIK